MAEPTRAELLKAFDDAVTPHTEVALETLSLGIDPQQFFCEHWDEIKPVLKWIADKIGGIPAVVIKGVIAAGDFLHSQVCPTG